MKLMKRIIGGVVLVGVAVMMSGCLATVGSERWCQNMRDKPKADWSAGDAVDFAKHCIIK
jgi:cell division septation protein DedD